MILGATLTRLSRPDGLWPTGISPRTVRIPTLHWYDVETALGVYDWTKADAIFGKIPADVEVLLAFSGIAPCYSMRPDEAYRNKSFPNGTQTAPTDLAALARYIRELLVRYPQIKFVEGWNEPNASFTGTIDELVEIQRTINSTVRAYNRINGTDIKVLSPKWGFDPVGIMAFEEFFGRTGAYDIIAFHSTPKTLDPMEFHCMMFQLKQLRQRFPKIADRPWWSVEGGWHGFSAMPTEQQISLLQMAHSILSPYADRWYHFAYDEATMGFMGNAAVEAAFNGLNLQGA